MALPINHLKQTLDRCCGQWEFDGHPNTNINFRVRFLNTNRVFVCIHFSTGWQAFEVVDENKPWANLCPRLTGILNGLTRNDAGELPADFDCVPGVE